MQMFVTAQASREQMAKEFARRQAVLQSGWAFIILQLKDMKKKRVAAVEDLIPRPTESQDNPGMVDYEFDVKQGQLVFDKDPQRGGIYTAYLLDTDHNRAFLAAHWPYMYWKIVDVIPGGNDGKEPITLAQVIEDVKKRHEQNMSVVIRRNKPPDPMPFKHDEMSEEEIDKEIARLEEIKRKKAVAAEKEKEMEKIPIGALRKKLGRPPKATDEAHHEDTPIDDLVKVVES